MQFIEGQTLAAMIGELRKKDISRRGAEHAEKSAEQKSSSASSAPLRETSETLALAALSTVQSTTDPAFFRTVANLGIQAAEALEHAHTEGVIHRDIKPGNLLVDAKANLWITDFGLARLGTDAGLTMSGDLLGTLRYMSPEQALAKRVVVDHRTDVYSLGVTLYEVLTLEPAFNGKDREEILRQIAFAEPKPPRRLNKAIPAELETIVLKAMEKNPEERYGTAGEMADDLRRWLEHKPILAKRPTMVQRLQKWRRRHEAVVTAIGVVGTLGLLTTLAVLLGSFLRLQKSKREVDHAFLTTLQAKRDLEFTNYSLRLFFAERRLRFGTAEELRELTGLYLHSARQDGVRTLAGHSSRAHGVAFSPDAQHIASASIDGTVKLWDANTGKEVHAFRQSGLVWRVAFSPDGRYLAATTDVLVKVWDVVRREEVCAFIATRVATLRLASNPHLDPIVFDLAFSPDGRHIATAGGEGKIKVWNARTGEEVSNVEGHLAVAYSPSGTQLATAVHSRGHALATQVQIYDASTGELLQGLQKHVASVFSLAFSPNGRYIASAGWDNVVLIGDIATGRETSRLKGHSDAVNCVAYSPDGRYIASASLDGTVRVWSAPSGREIAVLRGHLGPVHGVAFSPNGSQLVSAGGHATKGEVKVWEKRLWANE